MTTLSPGSSIAAPVHAAGADARIVRIGELALTFLLDAADTAGNLVAFEFAVPSRARVPAPHFHRDVDEAVYGLEGALTTVVDGRSQTVGPGDAVFVRRGSVHHHENRGEGLARALIVMTPGSIDRRYFEELAAAINVAGKPDLEHVKTIMLRYGLVAA